MGDLRVLRYAIETKQAFGELDHPIKVFMPKSPTVIAEGIYQPDLFDTEYIHEDMVIEIKGLLLRFALMKHL